MSDFISLVIDVLVVAASVFFWLPLLGWLFAPIYSTYVENLVRGALITGIVVTFTSTFISCARIPIAP